VRENGTLTWLISDHLGSTSVTVNAAGVLLSSLKYTAFGELRSGTATTDYLYTGQRQETEIGLYFYISRFYDPALGRFISADSIIPGEGNPQAYDRYSYTRNNPVNRIDPTGHVDCDDWDGCTIRSILTVTNYSGSANGMRSNPIIVLVNNGNVATKSDSGKNNAGKDDDITFPSPSYIAQEDLRDQGNTYKNETTPPSNSIYGLVATGILLHGATIIIEAGIVWGEISLAPISVTNPLIGVPLEIIIGAAGLAVLDFDLAYWSYTYRVYANPYQHQEFEIAPPWGFVH